MIANAVSIHVPARGTTLLCTTLFACKKSFNPRSREGNDEIDGKAVNTDTGVSIHVPARGTTEAVLGGLQEVKVFQSTFPRGERHPVVISDLRTK